MIGVVFAWFWPLELLQIVILGAVPLLIVAQGAALVSLGLAMATWIKRPDHATAAAIAILVFVVAGWPIIVTNVTLFLLAPAMLLLCLVVAAFARIKRPGPALVLLTISLGFAVAWPILLAFNLRDEDPSQGSIQYVIWENGMTMGSPIVNVAMPLFESLDERSAGNRGVAGVLILVVGWTVIYGLVAWGLFEPTVWTVDRCLGRIPEGSHRFGSRLKGWGWRTPGAGGRPGDRAASFAPRPR